jgi:hypothetical protein
MLDDRDEVLKQARSYASPAAPIKALVEDLEAARLPRYEPGSSRAVSAMEAKVRCEGPSSSCPTVVIVAPNGTVYSPFTPAAPPAGSPHGGLAVAATAAAVPRVGDGTYRTFLIGGDPSAQGEIELHALGAVKKLPILQESQQSQQRQERQGSQGSARTVAATVIGGIKASNGFRRF